MEKTKAYLATAYDAAANLPTFANGVITALGDDGSGGVVNSSFSIALKDIIGSSFASFAAGVTQVDSVTVGAPTVGDVLVITLQRVTSRQVERKTFRHYVVAGDTAASIATAFRAQINDHGIYTATGATTEVLIEVDSQAFTTVVSTGLTLLSDGTNNSVEFVQAVGLPADATEDGLSVLGTAYDVFEIQHYIDVPSGTFKKTEERSIVISRIYTQQAPSDLIANFHSAVATSLASMLEGDYTPATAYHDTGIGTVA